MKNMHTDVGCKGNQFVLLDLQSQERRMKTGIERGMDKWDRK